MPKVSRRKIVGAGNAPNGGRDIPLPRVQRVRKKLQNNGDSIRRDDSTRSYDWSTHWPFDRATGITLEILNQRQPKEDYSQTIGEALI